MEKWCTHSSKCISYTVTVYYVAGNAGSWENLCLRQRYPSVPKSSVPLDTFSSNYHFLRMALFIVINVDIYHFFRALRACPGTHSERYIIRALTSAPPQPGPRAARAPGVESRHRPLCPESNSSHFSLLLVKDCPLVQSVPLISSLTTSLLTYLAELAKSILGACQVAEEI